MIADVLTSIKAYLYDRTSSPLLGAFATSLALWNFKILMLFFSKTPYAVKVWEIDFFYSQPFFPSIDGLSWVTNYWMCLYLMPLATSLFYIYVFPWFSHRVFEFSYNKQIALNNKKKEMQGSELISMEEKEELLASIERLNVESRANALKLREEVSKLENQLDSVISEREELKAENNKLRVEVDKAKIKSKVSGESSDRAFRSDNDLLRDIHRDEIARNFGNPASSVYVSDGRVDQPTSSTSDNEQFYYEASESRKQMYLRILQGLYLGPRKQPSFGMPLADFDDAMSDLVMNGFVFAKNTRGEYKITSDGIDFYMRLKRGSKTT